MHFRDLRRACSSWLRYRCQRCHGVRYLRIGDPCTHCVGTGRGAGPSAGLALVVVLICAHSAMTWHHRAAVAAFPVPLLLVLLDRNVRPVAVWAALTGCLALLGLWGSALMAFGCLLWPRTPESIGGRLLAPLIPPRTEPVPRDAIDDRFRPDACAQCGVIRKHHADQVRQHAWIDHAGFCRYQDRHRVRVYRLYWRPRQAAPPLADMLRGTGTAAIGGWSQSRGKLWIEASKQVCERFQRQLADREWGQFPEMTGPTMRDTR